MKDLKETLTMATGSVMQTASDFVRGAKITVELTAEEEKLKNIYIDIGRKVHEIYAYGGSVGPFFDKSYAAIKSVEDRIAELKKRKEEFKHKKSAPIPPEAADNEFIVPAQIVSEEVVTENPAPKDAENKRVCTVCGTTCGALDKFCLGCGRSI